MSISKINSIAMGVVKLKGKAKSIHKSSKELIAPISRRRCIFYQYLINATRTINKEQYIRLEDTTGSVLVDLNNAQIFSNQITFSYKDIKENKEFNSILSEKNIFIGLYPIGVRVDEFIIRENDTLFIIGTAVDNPFVKETEGKVNTDDIMISENNTLFYISSENENTIIKELKSDFLKQLALSFLLSLILIPGMIYILIEIWF